MKRIIGVEVSVLLILSIMFSFSSCSGKKAMTEENIIETVAIVNTALNEFDTKTLSKYVESETLSYILKFADKHEQFVELGKAIFKDLTMEVESVDLDAKTVTVKVHNKKLETQGKDFANGLMERFSTLQLLNKLNDDSFLDSSLSELVEKINSALLSYDATVTLSVKEGKKNLVLGFDENAENAVSGGSLSSIKSIYS